MAVGPVRHGTCVSEPTRLAWPQRIRDGCQRNKGLERRLGLERAFREAPDDRFWMRPLIFEPTQTDNIDDDADRLKMGPDKPPDCPPRLVCGRAHDRKGFDAGDVLSRIEGEARHFIDEHRRLQARPIPRSRARRLEEAARRLEQDHAAEREANQQYEAWRARGIAADGSRRMAPGTTKPYQPPETPAGTINTTDPDSRIVRRKGQPATQGYNCQAAVTEHQIIVAAEVTVVSPDFGHLQPMVDATTAELEKVGVTELPEVVLADPGYWHTKQMEAVVGRGIQVLIPPDSGLRTGSRPGWDNGLYAFMRAVLATEHGQAIYRRRMATVEPVFGQIKYNRRFDRFHRRGRAAVRSEWRLAAATHNLLKLHRHRIAAAGA